jgi:ankyrin repeat protein
VEARDGDSALHWAVFQGREPIVCALLEVTASPALHLSHRTNDCSLQAGADVNSTSAVHGQTPLDIAVQQQLAGRASGIAQLLAAKGGLAALDKSTEGAGEL